MFKNKSKTNEIQTRKFRILQFSFCSIVVLRNKIEFKPKTFEFHCSNIFQNIQNPSNAKYDFKKINAQNFFSYLSTFFFSHIIILYFMSCYLIQSQKLYKFMNFSISTDS